MNSLRDSRPSCKEGKRNVNETRLPVSSPGNYPARDTFYLRGVALNGLLRNEKPLKNSRAKIWSYESIFILLAVRKFQFWTDDDW